VSLVENESLELAERVWPADLNVKRHPSIEYLLRSCFYHEEFQIYSILPLSIIMSDISQDTQ
jgi:hypothetical protein